MSSTYHFVKKNKQTTLPARRKSVKEHFLRSRVTETEIRKLMWKQ